MTNKATVAGP